MKESKNSVLAVLLLTGIILFFVFNNGGDTGIRKDFVLELKRIERNIDSCNDFNEAKELLEPLQSIVNKIEMVDTSKSDKESKYVTYIKSKNNYDILNSVLRKELISNPDKDMVLKKYDEKLDMLERMYFSTVKSSISMSVKGLLTYDEIYD